MSWTHTGSAYGTASATPGTTGVSTGSWDVTPADGEELVMFVTTNQTGGQLWTIPGSGETVWIAVDENIEGTNGGTVSMFRRIADSEPAGGYTVVNDDSGFNAMMVEVHSFAPSEGSAEATPTIPNPAGAHDDSFNSTDSTASITPGSGGAARLLVCAHYTTGTGYTVSTAPADGASNAMTPGTVREGSGTGMMVFHWHLTPDAAATSMQITWSSNGYGSAIGYSTTHSAGGGDSFDIFQLAVG